MPKLKVGDDELDVKELEDADYNEDGGDYEDYDGPQPPKGTRLVGFIKKMWWTYSANENPMLKVLFVADDNRGDAKQYDGCPIWENAALIASVKFRWAPMLGAFGLTIRDVKTKTIIAEDEDNNGWLIEKIKDWEPGTDEAYCTVITKREKYEDEWNVKVDKWLPYSEPADDAYEAEADGDVGDVDDGDDGDDGEEETAPARGRGRAAAAKATPARGKAPARSSARAGRGSATATKTASAKPTRGRGRAKGSDDDPPF